MAAIDRRLLSQSKAARLHLGLAGALGATSAGLIVAQASLLAYAIDRAAMHHASLSSLEGTLIALAAVLAVRAAASAAFELSGRLGAAKVLSQLRGKLVDRLLLQRPGEWARRPESRRTGELAATAVDGVDALQAWFAGYLPQLVLATLVPIAVLAMVASLDPIAASILAVTAPLLVLFMVLIGKRAAASSEDRRRALSLLSAHFLDVVRGLPELRAHRRERAQARTLADVGERYRAETMATLRVAFLSSFVLELCAMIGVALVAATIGVQLVEGSLGLQAGLLVLLLAPEMYAPLREVGRQFHAGADGAAAANRIFEALEDGQGPEDAVGRDALAAQGATVVSGVSGTPGASAARGASVVSGVSGASVASGVSGTPGASAARSASVVSGVSGASVVSGVSGASVVSGVSGTPDPRVSPIRLRGVTHRYPGRSEPALLDVDLELEPGAITALVGPSGAGKSTIAALLLGLIEADAGVMECGGVDLAAVDRESWRRQIAWVPQRPTIFSGTVAENIALAEPEACLSPLGRSRIERAAGLAGAGEFVAELPVGLDTPVGEGGRRLSAGQARRVALARAFMRERAGLMVLDEPTAHLDLARAREVVDAIRSFSVGRTTLLIAHSALAAAIADRVIALRDGEVASAGHFHVSAALGAGDPREAEPSPRLPTSSPAARALGATS